MYRFLLLDGSTVDVSKYQYHRYFNSNKSKIYGIKLLSK